MRCIERDQCTVEREAGQQLELDPGEVDLWLASLDCPPAPLRAMTTALSADETERKFHFEADRARFIKARAILRDLLSRYLDCTAGEIAFAYEPSGKPRLGGIKSSTTDLRFNLSHSADAALYAIARGRELGVDIESIRPEMLWGRLANCFFCPSEVVKLHEWPAPQRMFGFFTCWSRKEAYIKARGGGLSIPLNSFEVSVAPGEEPALLAAADPDELKRWSFWEVPLGESFAGALVVDGRPSRVRLLTWHWSQLGEAGCLNTNSTAPLLDL
ncbi:MAG: 4'-phosphopantetheinyl transferase superfamily protein [Deltaproteobacteria bacterium]|nr:4'-phosphopantetheinyl transferase superfamily protein [Deltaproteobacteria bacterium]